MNEHEFFYWLQGWFELLELSEFEGESLSVEQLSCIAKHAKLVRAVESTVSHSFVTIETLVNSDVQTDALTVTIRTLLAMQFKRVIDQKYGDAEKQDELNEIHNGDDLNEQVQKFVNENSPSPPPKKKPMPNSWRDRFGPWEAPVYRC